MHAALSDALAIVLRDVSRTGALLPRVEDVQWSDVPGQGTAMLIGPGGDSTGVFVMLDESAANQVAGLADQVQDWEVEALASSGRSASWPGCPQHRGSHPLKAVVLSGAAVWVCPESRDRISAIGELPGTSA